MEKRVITLKAFLTLALLLTSAFMTYPAQAMTEIEFDENSNLYADRKMKIENFQMLCEEILAKNDFSDVKYRNKVLVQLIASYSLSRNFDAARSVVNKLSSKDEYIKLACQSMILRAEDKRYEAADVYTKLSTIAPNEQQKEKLIQEAKQIRIEQAKIDALAEMAQETDPAKISAQRVSYAQFRQKNELFNDQKIPAGEFQALCEKILSKDAITHDEYRESVVRALFDAYLDSDRYDKVHELANRMKVEYPTASLSYTLSALRLEGKTAEFAAMCRQEANKIKDPEGKKRYLQMAKEAEYMFETIDISVVLLSFEKNIIGGEESYKRKTLLLGGNIDDITVLSDGTPCIILSGRKQSKFRAGFMFEKKDRSALAKLEKGQRVLISAKCIGIPADSTVVFTDSEIVSY